MINSEILINSDYNDDSICRFIEFGIEHQTDIDFAKNIMAEEIARHPNYINPKTDEKNNAPSSVEIKVVRMTDNAVILRGTCWAETPDSAFNMYCDLLESIKKRFDKAGVKIAFQSNTVK